MSVQCIRSFFLGLLILTLTSLNANAQEAEKPLSPIEVIEIMEVSANNRDLPQLWKVVPEDFKTEMTKVVHGFGSKMDPELWEQSFETLRKISKVLKEKKNLILEQNYSEKRLDKEKLSATVDELASIIDMLTKSKIAKLDDVQQLDLDVFINGTVTKTFHRVFNTIESMHPEMKERFEKYQAADFKILEMKEDTALVEFQSWIEYIEEDGSRFSKFAAKRPLAKIDGKWYAKEMQNLKPSAQDILANMSPENMKWIKMQTLPVLAMINASLDEMLAAKTNAEFTPAFDQLRKPAELFLIPMFEELGKPARKANPVKRGPEPLK